jgi:hypothetical protein
MSFLTYEERFAHRNIGDWVVGSTDKRGGHSRNQDGWPYDIYRLARDVGERDAVLAHGIPCFQDATELCRLLNADRESKQRAKK